MKFLRSGVLSAIVTDICFHPNLYGVYTSRRKSANIIGSPLVPNKIIDETSYQPDYAKHDFNGTALH